jgi:hypothetical protein
MRRVMSVTALEESKAIHTSTYIHKPHACTYTHIHLHTYAMQVAGLVILEESEPLVSGCEVCMYVCIFVCVFYEFYEFDTHVCLNTFLHKYIWPIA